MPIDCNGIVSSIHEVAYANLLASLGVKEDVVVLDAVQRITLNSESVLTSLGVDTGTCTRMALPPGATAKTRTAPGKTSSDRHSGGSGSTRTTWPPS